VSDPLLQVQDLSVCFGDRSNYVKVVDNVSFTVGHGEVFALVGESGSGKSTMAHAILRTLQEPGFISAGRVLFEGQDIFAFLPDKLRQFRWSRISIVFQGALNVLNPVLSVGEQIRDTLAAHEAVTKAAARARAQQLLQQVGIDPVHVESYPHELSGGMRQRVAIAIALALQPQLMIMDEPTTALDVIVQQEILQQLEELRQRLGFSILFISHDLSLMLQYSQRIAVVYGGRIVECGPAREILENPKHPYTQGLLDSFPQLHGPLVRHHGIPGLPPDPRHLPLGCAFQPRCGQALPLCSSQIPDLISVDPGRSSDHWAACHLVQRG